MSMAAAEARAGTVSRDKLLSDPRSGARPLGNSDPGPGRQSPPAGRPGPQGRPGPEGPQGHTEERVRTVDTSAPSEPRQRKASSAVRASRQFSAPEFHNYQGIILAEFIMAELLVAATPIATRQNLPGLSPYIPRDMTKMLSIGLLYFILELSAVGSARWGRVGAWFGGLILIVVGLNEAASITKVLDLFGSEK